MPASAPYDPPLRTLKTPSGPVSYTIEGEPEAPAVLCVHGAPGSVRDFRYLGPQLARRGLRVIRVDSPGFGGTHHATSAGHSSRGRAVFLRRFATALGLERFAIAAHSLGGGAALVLGGLHPDRVLGLCLINSVGVERHKGLTVPEGAHRAMARAWGVPPVARRMIPAARRQVKALGFAGVESWQAEEFRVLFQLLGEQDFGLHRKSARRVRSPVLVASADDDPFIEPARAHALVNALGPHATAAHLRFARGGHYLQKHEAVRIAEVFASLLLDGRDQS
jgi:pimeloyl-ACP methyl ester carboxylesterase